MGGGGGQKAAYETSQVGDIQFALANAEGLNKDEVRALVDSIRHQVGSGVVLVTVAEPGKVSLVASVSRDLTTRVSAGELVKRLAPIVGGRGGGRPDFAEAGGKDDAKISELRQHAPAVLKDLLGV
jgi:alanyl-tRNA synthetase